MRRLIDSILFALVAYTLAWPLIRGFGTEGSEPSTPPRADLLVRVLDSAAPMRTAAIVNWRSDSGDMGSPVTQAVDSELPVQLKNVPTDGPIKLDIRVPGLAFDVQHVVAHDDDTEVSVKLPADAARFFGEATDAHGQPLSKVFAQLPHADGELAVDCDADGRFFFAASRAKLGEQFTLRIRAEGHPPTERALTDRASHDLGRLQF